MTPSLLFMGVVMPEISGRSLTTKAVVRGGILDAGINMLGKPVTLQRLAAKLHAVLDEA